MEGVKKIIDQQVMEEFFRNSLDLFPEATELVSLKINRHNPNFVLDPKAILAEYRLVFKKADGTEFETTLRGSADPSFKRRKHYQVLKALWGKGFGEGENIVARPVAYIEEFHLLLYVNILGQSLYDKFKWVPEDVWTEKIWKAIDWLIEFHSKKPVHIPDADFDWQEEKNKFRELIGSLNHRYPDHEALIRAVTERMMREEKEIIDEDKLHLIHGDYQPHNIIFSDYPQKTVVIDFNDSMYYDELYDLSYFLTQTKTMLYQITQKDYSSLNGQIIKYYFEKRGLTYDEKAERKINLFRLKTLMHIKAVTELKTVKNIIPELETYAKQTV